MYHPKSNGFFSALLYIYLSVRHYLEKMNFGKARHFKNSFSEQLNSCNENEVDGIIITIRRFKYFIESISEQIDKDNKAIQIDLSNEDTEVALDMRMQFNIDSNLNYFLDNILKSNLVGIYSYFEYTLKKISKICESNLNPRKTLGSYKSGALINRYNSFLIDQVIPLLSAENAHFEKILVWNQLRNDIVHQNSIIERFNPQDLKHSSLLIKRDSFQFLKSDIILDFLFEIESYLYIIITLINKKHDLIEYVN
ncbi:hypothetical protein R3X28_11355 [Maribacter sp. TH_r10]|uniref:hypothetical protein n=1 Tax=Maribacter sp. TH_r10 TaxID=3082086 RepID=UPI0029555836|nr:hypothetical protein [Maribacter sp. TH_r10]MDV7139478.1 hypothetical protein [Maribacter sp. TH_r10]